MIETTNRPNPERVYATIAKILERKYGVKITYTLIQKPKGAQTHEHYHH